MYMRTVDMQNHEYDEIIFFFFLSLHVPNFFVLNDATYILKNGIFQLLLAISTAIFYTRQSGTGNKLEGKRKSVQRRNLYLKIKMFLRLYTFVMTMNYR